MANLKITELTALSTQPADGDLLPIVDVNDTTDSVNGTTKKITYDTMIPDASATVYGKTKLSTAPASATAPIAVGDNDTRLPSQGENDALVGTSGTPSTSNPYATKATTDLLQTIAGMPSRQYLVGAQTNDLVKTYFNIQLPFTLWTGSTSEALTTDFANWIRTDATKVSIPAFGLMAYFGSTGAATLYLFPPIYTGGNTSLSFDASSNIVILDFWAKYISGTGECFWGFSTDETYYDNNYADDNNRVGFMIANGVLYATSGVGGGTDQQTNIGATVTETIWNNYRIEMDIGADTARYYVNGVLLHTESTVFPSSGNVYIGFGRNTTNPVLFNVTAPTLSIEMNP